MLDSISVVAEWTWDFQIYWTTESIEGFDALIFIFLVEKNMIYNYTVVVVLPQMIYRETLTFIKQSKYWKVLY